MQLKPRPSWLAGRVDALLEQMCNYEKDQTSPNYRNIIQFTSVWFAAVCCTRNHITSTQLNWTQPEDALIMSYSKNFCSFFVLQWSSILFKVNLIHSYPTHTILKRDKKSHPYIHEGAVKFCFGFGFCNWQSVQMFIQYGRRIQPTAHR